MIHPQIHSKKVLILKPREYEIKVSPVKPTYKESNRIAVDRFFEQEHNLRNGFICTSPEMLDNSSAGHFESTPNNALPSDLSNDEIFDMIVPRSVETLAEVSKLSHLRPVQEVEQQLHPDDPIVNDNDSNQNVS